MPAVRHLHVDGHMPAGRHLHVDGEITVKGKAMLRRQVAQGCAEVWLAEDGVQAVTKTFVGNLAQDGVDRAGRSSKVSISDMPLGVFEQLSESRAALQRSADLCDLRWGDLGEIDLRREGGRHGGRTFR